MKRDPLTYGIIGVLIGGVAVWAISVNAVNNNVIGTMRMMGMRSGGTQQSQVTNQQYGMGMGMGSSMNDMMGSLPGRQGSSFDKAFIEAMIPHHQGAIEMAKVAQQKAEHEEIKELADGIIEAQTADAPPGIHAAEWYS